MIKIISLREGFRRAGISHSTNPVLHEDDAFTPEELKALQGDSMLVVEVVKRGPGRPPKTHRGPFDGEEDKAEAETETETVLDQWPTAPSKT